MSPSRKGRVLQAGIAIVKSQVAIEGLVDLNFGACEAKALWVLRNLKTSTFPLDDIVIAYDAFMH